MLKYNITFISNTLNEPQLYTLKPIKIITSLIQSHA